VCLAWLVSGRTVAGTRLYAESNCLDRETALRLYTKDVAWFSAEEGKKGQLQVGQLADLVVPTQDYLRCPAEEIASITSDLTLVGGRVVYAAGAFASLDPEAPPPMPDWSPVRHFGGYGASGWDKAPAATAPVVSQHLCVPRHVRHAGGSALWGAIGCACWAF
jgi:hypothetical protein